MYVATKNELLILFDGMNDLMRHLNWLENSRGAIANETLIELGSTHQWLQID